MEGPFLQHCKNQFGLRLRCAQEEDVAYHDDDDYCRMDWTPSAEELETESAFQNICFEQGWQKQQNIPGMIKRIYVENFLRFQSYEVHLCRNVNVVIEQPGTTSTLFTAIQVAFGGTAADVGFVRHLNELVLVPDQNEASPGVIARVCVTLENGREDGYERDIYGDEITIVRLLSSRCGCYGFKILDCDGVEQSRSKKDLLTMLKYLNVSIDNPAAILKQARAKRVGQPKDMYRFFANATKLEGITETFSLIDAEIAKFKTLKSQLKSSVRAKTKEVASLKRSFDEEKEELLYSGASSTNHINHLTSNVKDTYNEIQEMLESVRTQFQVIHELEQSQTDLCRKYYKAKREMEQQKELTSLINQNIELLEEDLMARKKRLKKEQTYLVTIASVCFDECLQANNSKGKLMVDFDKGELTLAVHKNVHRESFPTRNESRDKDEEYTSMAFLMSISEALGFPVQCSLLHPQHCRSLLMNLLATSRKFQNRQFIFLTSTDAPKGVEQDEQLKIIRL